MRPLRRVCLTVALLAAAGCATEPVPMSEATVTTVILNPALTAKRKSTGALTFKRDTGMSNMACSFRLFADGAPFADLSAGEMITIHLLPGDHIVGARSNGICFAGNAEMQVVVKSGEQRVYRVSVTSGGSLALQPTAF